MNLLVIERWYPTQAKIRLDPDFLWRLVALIHCMRLSLMKGAHAGLSSTAWQEIGVKPYFGLSGIHSTRPVVELSRTPQKARDQPSTARPGNRHNSPRH